MLEASSERTRSKKRIHICVPRTSYLCQAQVRIVFVFFFEILETRMLSAFFLQLQEFPSRLSLVSMVIFFLFQSVLRASNSSNSRIYFCGTVPTPGAALVQWATTLRTQYKSARKPLIFYPINQGEDFYVAFLLYFLLSRRTGLLNSCAIFKKTFSLRSNSRHLSVYKRVSEFFSQ